MHSVFLSRPSPADLEEAAQYKREFLQAGDSMDGCGPLRRLDGEEWLRTVEDYSKEETCPADRVVATQFLLKRREDGRILGMLQVRHTLNEYLKNYAGHIGYSVRPSERRRGYAKKMLALALPYCHSLGLSRVLISCEPHNEASRRVILSAGGIYDKTVHEPGEDIDLERYFVPTCPLPPKAVLFDLDGTVTDPGEGITNAVAYALAKYGIEVKDKKSLYPFIGPPLADSFRRYYGFSSEKAAQSVAYYREYYRDRGIFENRVYDGMPEALAACRNGGLRVLLATSKPEEFALRILKHFSLEGLFHGIYGATMSGSRVEKADVIRYALESEGLSPEECVMVGDRRFDVEGAALCGMRSLGVAWGYGSEEELRTARAHGIARTPKELLSLLPL